MNTDLTWRTALDETLADMDTFSDWLYSECIYQPDVDRDFARGALAFALSTTRQSAVIDKARPQDLLWVALTDACPLTVDAAIQAFRGRYLAAQSERVAALVYAEQDRAQEAA